MWAGPHVRSFHVGLPSLMGLSLNNMALGDYKFSIIDIKF